MRTVSGLVSVQETLTPVSGVQVILYEAGDIENGKSAQPQDLPVPPAGQRLGSRITDPDGSFRFAFETLDGDNSANQPGGFEVLVVAPEDVSFDAKTGAPHSLCLEDRVLYRSADHIGFGSQEQLLIRLPAKQLTRFNIASDLAADDPNVVADSVARSIDGSTVVDHRINELATERLQQVAKPAFEVRKHVNKALKTFTLSAFPDDIRNLPTYLTERSEVDAAEDVVAEQSISSIVDMDSNANVNRKLELSLTEEELAELDVQFADDESEQGEIDTKELFRYLDQRNTSSLVREVASVKTCSRERAVESRFSQVMERCAPETDSDADSDPVTDGDTESVEINAEAFVKEHVDRQTKHATAPEVELKYGVERDGEITATFNAAPTMRFSKWTAKILNSVN